ncbi:MAG: DUF4270 domain-containing protein, partial [Mariniphaga sp.]|nr:DUF4270 domain-containing protein [Mariniphaga sp.]
TSCNEPNDLGMNLLPSTDLIEINNIVEKNSISSYTYTEDAIRTDEATRSLLGIFDDPVFGRTTINFASQFRMQYTPNYGTNPEADSIMLYLYYRYIYGDSTTTQRINVYELNENLIVDTTSASGGTYDYPYYQNVDLKSMASSEKIGEIEFVPEIKQDSVYGDTLYQLLKIPLNISLADKLVNADSTHMVNNDQFLEFFKGLYFESEKDAGQGGAIISLEAAAGSNFQGSALLVYYNNAENKLKASPDTLYYPYVISKFSARVNSITHDYSGTSFYPNLNTETGNDSLIFLQSTGGLKSKILIDNLIQWRDSANTAINKAELIFQIDSVISEVDKYAPPSQLLLLAINEEGKEYIPIDYYFSPLFYNGRLNSQDYTYKFNITQHLQQIIDGETENYGFFLSTARKNSEANRVVIKGHNSHTGIRLIITYSKFLQ